jgi:hydrogenase nickel incorporation protein HypB
MKIRVVQNVLEANRAKALDNRQLLQDAGVLCVNVLSAPGSGKTTLLQKTMAALGAEHRCAVLVGDLQTTRDAERLVDGHSQVVQINTGEGCHLTSAQVAEGLSGLELSGLSFLFIENVGNMVCPASFDLGEHVRAVLLSTPEGNDKVAKYPVLFQTADVILLTKVDLVEVLGYDARRVRADLATVNTAAPLIELSSRTGQGFESWLEWLKAQRRQRAGQARAGKA